MKILSIEDLTRGGRHILSGLVPGDYLSKGGLNFKAPGHRSHDVGCTCDACDGKGRHVHEDDHEIFIVFQGTIRAEIDGTSHGLSAGDVLIVEPGEEHHLVSQGESPCVNVYLHTSDVPNPRQR